MTLVAALAGALALLALPGRAARWGRRLPAREWATLVAVSVGAGGALLWLALLFLAAPTLLGALGLSSVAAWCLRMLGSLAPGGSALGWAAAGTLLSLVVSGGRSLARAARVRRALRGGGRLAEPTRLGGVEVLLLPTPEPLAMAAGGRVVISRGLVEELSEEQLAVVVAHEAAHLRHRHHRWFLLAQAVRGALGWLAPVRHSLEALELALERWADEAAAPTPERRRALGEALLVASGVGGVPVPGLASADTVLERLEALGRPAPVPASTQRARLYAPVAAVGGLAAGSLGLWVGQAQVVLVHAGLCVV